MGRASARTPRHPALNAHARTDTHARTRIRTYTNAHMHTHFPGEPSFATFAANPLIHVLYSVPTEQILARRQNFSYPH